MDSGRDSRKVAFQAARFSGELTEREKSNDVGHFVGTIDTRGFQNFSGGFMVHREWERPQALRTGQNNEGESITSGVSCCKCNRASKPSFAVETSYPSASSTLEMERRTVRHLRPPVFVFWTW